MASTRVLWGLMAEMRALGRPIIPTIAIQARDQQTPAPHSVIALSDGVIATSG